MLAVFDLDGCLLDTLSITSRALNALRVENKLEVLSEDTIRQCMGGSSRKMVERVMTANNPAAKAWMSGDNHLLERYTQILLDFLREAKSYPGVETSLETLKSQGFKLAILSNRAESMVRPLIKATNLEAFFTHQNIVGSGGVWLPKPSPEALIHLMAINTTSKNACVMIGDSDVDIQAAKNAGVHSVGCLYGYGDVTSESPSVCVEQASDIAGVVFQSLNELRSDNENF